MDNSEVAKHSLYKPAGSLQRTSYLHQGKLLCGDSPSSQHTEESALQNSLPWSPTTAEKLNRFQPPPVYPSGEHTHSLSLSDSEEDATLPSQKAKQAVSADQTNDPPRSSNQVLLVDASVGNSSALGVSSMKIPSPVKVVREEDRDWRRFSNNFADALPSSVPPVVCSSSDSKLKSNNVQEQSVAPSKRRKGHIVPSRYMSGDTKATKLISVSKSSSSVSSSVTRQSSSTKSKPSKLSGHRTNELDGFKVPSVAPRLKKMSSKPRHQEMTWTPVNSAQGITTSTPLHQISGQVTHDGSYMADFDKVPSAVKSMKSKPTNEAHHNVDELEMELLYNRLIQLTYLDILSYKALKEQETKAKVQLYELWQAVESSKEECHLLAKKLLTEDCKLTTEKVLDSQSNHLGPVCSRLPLLKQQYGLMAQALDATRHDMVMEGMLPIQEGEIEAELIETEVLMGDISASIRRKLQEVLNFSSSSEAMLEMLIQEYHGINGCFEDLSKLLPVQVQTTSLNFEQVYRTT